MARAAALLLLLLVAVQLVPPAAAQRGKTTLEDLVGTEYTLYTLRLLDADEMRGLANKLADAYGLETPSLRRVYADIHGYYQIYSAMAKGVKVSATIVVGSLGEFLIVQDKRYAPKQWCLSAEDIARLLGDGKWEVREDGNITLKLKVRSYIIRSVYTPYGRFGSTWLEESWTDHRYKEDARVIMPFLNGVPFRPAWIQGCGESLVVVGAIPPLGEPRTYKLTRDEAERLALNLGVRSPEGIVVEGAWLAIDRKLMAVVLVLQLNVRGETRYAMADPYTLRLYAVEEPPVPWEPGAGWRDWLTITSESKKPPEEFEPFIGTTGAIGITLAVTLLVAGIFYGWHRWGSLAGYSYPARASRTLS